MPLIITDYEIAISNAIKQVFPNTQVRGCWYHYWNNILCQSGLLNRVTGQRTRKLVINFLSVLPFLHNQELFLHKMIQHFGYTGKLQRHRDVNYKVIMYVYSTYVKRFRHLFSIDFSLSFERTNNVCEGSNSGLSKHSAQRLNLREFTDYVENQFKKQYVSKPERIRDANDLDKVLLCLQESSKVDLYGVFEVIIGLMDKDDFKIVSINPEILRAIKLKQERIDDDQDKATVDMNGMLSDYKKTRVERRKIYRQLKKEILETTGEEILLVEEEMKLDDFDYEDEMLENGDGFTSILELDNSVHYLENNQLDNPLSVSTKTHSFTMGHYSKPTTHTIKNLENDRNVTYTRFNCLVVEN